MSSDLSISNVSGSNPLLGLHAYITAMANGRYTENGIDLPGAEAVNEISLDILTPNR